MDDATGKNAVAYIKRCTVKGHNKPDQIFTEIVGLDAWQIERRLLMPNIVNYIEFEVSRLFVITQDFVLKSRFPASS